MAQPLDNAALDQLFDKARTHNKWQPREVPDELLKKIVEHMKWGPTSANCSPARIVFVKSQEAKARLKPHLSPGNVDKTMAAPATAILAYDLKFYDYLPRLFPSADAKSWFAGKKEHADITAFRNGSLQGGYFILAARALGLDCGPMSGFNRAKADAEFFKDGRFKSDFLCSLGYADYSKTYPRGPRFKFEDVCQLA